MIYNEKTSIQNLKNLSAQDFLTFGMHDVAYVRKVDVDGQATYAVHAADGTPLSVLDTIGEALHIIHHNDLESAAVH